MKSLCRIAARHDKSTQTSPISSSTSDSSHVSGDLNRERIVLRKKKKASYSYITSSASDIYPRTSSSTSQSINTESDDQDDQRYFVLIIKIN